MFKHISSRDSVNHVQSSDVLDGAITLTDSVGSFSFTCSFSDRPITKTHLSWGVGDALNLVIYDLLS